MFDFITQPNWARDCQHWRGLVLVGSCAHWCNDWDGLPVDETSDEWSSCTCLMRSTNNLHCWEDGPRIDDDCGRTCMLHAGHDGLHEWTRDDEIGVTFRSPTPKAT
jgi:hypothetical protein